MAHHHHRKLAAEHLGHLAGVIAGGVHHLLATHLALRRHDHPFVALAADRGHRAEALDPGPHLAGAFRQSLRQLRRVDVAVIGVMQGPRQVVGRDKGIDALDLVGGQDVQVHPLIAPHADDLLELHQPFPRVPQPDRAGDVVVHRVIDLGPEFPIQFRAVALHVHDRPGGGEGRHVPRRMPGAACRQLVLFQKQAIRPAGLREVIQGRDADGAAPDDDDTGESWEIGHRGLLDLAPLSPVPTPLSIRPCPRY